MNPAHPLSVLVIEDGHEYTEAYRRFLPDGFTFTRAGSGREALALLESPEGVAYEVVVLDMRFDRTPPLDLLGDVNALLDRFKGDAPRARRFLEDNQGTYVLAALRAAGVNLPALFCYDFTDEPRRFTNLQRLQGPLAWLPDNAGPDAVRAALFALAGQR